VICPVKLPQGNPIHKPEMTDSRGEMAKNKEVKSVKWPIVLPCGLINELEQPIFSSDSGDRNWECHGVPHFQQTPMGLHHST